ncbi:YbcC family protein [Acidimangrovimonas pyrenivorans]|uniref:Probable inorganic carbon transporter subunit DabA n=1 Tax=Acidimangrovimonas pyrenivorans TaxID=2030798 RepID=A0ABV7AJK7_9RHOB
MTYHSFNFPGATLALFAAAEHAIGQIPPSFPLDATVAVNPFLGQVGEPREIAAARLTRTAGARLTLPRATVADWIAEGRITDADLAEAAEATGLPVAALKAASATPAPDLAPDPTVADLLQAATGIDWPAFVEERIGLWAAAQFDRGQALWPALTGSPWRSWQAFAQRDLTPGLHGFKGFCAFVAGLPDDPRAAFAELCGQLGLTAEAAPLYLQRLLTTLGGWAQHARGLGWQAERDGDHDATAFELLLIRLAWEGALLAAFGDRVSEAWREALTGWAAPLAPSTELRIDLALQEAADRAEERRLAESFDGEGPAPRDRRPTMQAAFCIDVRSEPFRRALEAADSGVETLGFAGFFGLAVQHRTQASDLAEARAPVLLSPDLTSGAALTGARDEALRLKRRAIRAWGRFKLAAVSSFAFVEAAGPAYLGKLAKAALGLGKDAPAEPAPRLDLPLDARIAAAARVLRAMSLTRDFAPLVLIAGHGAHVTNAPHASALQCGACGGRAGDVNARLLAGLLNDPELRAGLADEGIEIPAGTRFVAGLHDTVSDRVTLFDDGRDTVPAPALAHLRQVLERAGAIVRTARAASLPRTGSGGDLPARGTDWSELRPEWGLAGCHAFIAAPRGRTTGRNLGGRAFLHSYDWQADADFKTLELILTAPLVVASWIALQYHGSAVAPEVFGAGNKLIHNVTGGIGVVEGNGGNLRPGLPWQSLHDGERLRHEPVRLAVVIEAPEAAISDVLDRQPKVKALFDNGWLSLHAMDAEGRIAARYDKGDWTMNAGTAQSAVQAA